MNKCSADVLGAGGSDADGQFDPCTFDCAKMVGTLVKMMSA